MKIVDINDEGLKTKLRQSIKSKNIVPFIGSGFTKGIKTPKGCVPSGTEMLMYMKEKLSQYYDNDIAEFNTWSFSQTANEYNKVITTSNKEQYLRNNFTYVVITDVLKCGFIEHDWDYLYTVNIDNGIENTNKDLRVIQPLKKIKESYINENKVLFKLHGDVDYSLCYEKEYNLILGTSDYAQSIRSNFPLLKILMNDFINKDIIYLGCSLDDELDLLSIRDFGIDQNNSQNTVYYITTENLSKLQQSRLVDYGVNTIIKLDEYDSFYLLIRNLFEECKNIPESEFESFCNKKTIVEDAGLDKNIKYILDSNYCFRENEKGRIYLPNFFIRRNVTDTIIDSITGNSIIYLLGNRVSGKTFVLIDILNRYREKSVLFFDSSLNISDQSIQRLINVKDQLLIFDTNTLSESQIIHISSAYQKLSDNNNNVIIAVNSFDKDILRTVNRNMHLIFELDNKYSDKEIERYNSLVVQSNINKYSSKYTILDYLLNIIDSDAFKDKNPIIFEIQTKQQIALFVLLLVKETISTLDIGLFDLEMTIRDLHSKGLPIADYKLKSIVEIDKLSKLKLCSNAKIWTYRILRDTASKKRYKDLITSAFCHIISTYLAENADTKIYGKFIKFDMINSFFKDASGGAGGLILEIYDKLESYLIEDWQFYHQRAKCVLTLRNDNLELMKRALHFIGMAIEETEKEFSKSKNYKLGISLLNMQFTEAIIYGRIAILSSFRSDILETSLKKYNDVLSTKGYKEFIDDFIKKQYLGNDTDLSKLIGYAMSNSEFINNAKDIKHTLNELTRNVRAI